MRDDGRKLVSPIIHYDDQGRVIPIYEVANPDDDTQEVINRYTPNSVRGNHLFKRIGGYDLFTNIDDTIVIDYNGANIFIYRNEIQEDISPANEREYLLLLVGLEDSGFEDTFRGIVGRQNVFDTVMEIIDVVDLHESKILAETTKLKGAITLYEFMRMCTDKNLVEGSDRFDPYDWDDSYYADIDMEE